MAVDPQGKLLPGVKGKDYSFIKFGGQVYAVYTMKLPGGGQMRISFKINQADYKAYGVDPTVVKGIPAASFQNIQHLGNAADVIRNGKDHPFQQYLQHLERINGPVSWLHDKQFLGTMMQGYFDGWDSTTLQKALTQTHWYKTRNETQRQWELNMGPADRKAAIAAVRSNVEEQLRTLYGADYKLGDAGFTKQKIDQIATQIASGHWGSSEEGFQIWTQQARNQAEDIEGTPAWITQEQTLEQQRAFGNRPEDVLKTLQDQSFQWLGPQGQPDQSTLQQWASDIVTQKSSEADWDSYLQTKARALYPWLGTNETWQDRASSYKNIAEQNLGTPIDWNDPLLSNLGAKDANGNPTGAPASFDDFTKAVRSDGRFWQGPQAAQETYGLFDKINNLFTGASS